MSLTAVQPRCGYDRLLGIVSVAVVTVLAYAVIWRRKRSGSGSGSKRLPPGPRGWPLVGNLLQVGLSGKPFIYVVRDLREQFGSIFTLKMGQRTLIVITSPELVHEALVERGHVFANRPPETPTRILFSENKCTVNSAEYGPSWRMLRRNLVNEMLNPSRVRDFGWIREWAVGRLLERLRGEADRNGGAVEVMRNVRFTAFSILLCMCFGTQLDEDVISDVDATLKEVLLIVEPKIHDFLPVLSPLFVGQRKRARELRAMQMASLLPLIATRRQIPKSGAVGAAVAYIDSLMSLQLEGRGRLSDGELVTLCSELLNAGTDTTATTLEWAMAHLVLDQKIQSTLFDEIVRVVGHRKVEEGDVDKLPYLKAVVRETLRRHPPGHFVLSHAVTEDCTLAGYHIPTKANVEFYTAWISYDPDIWTDPMEFKPERFLDPNVDVDITGAKHVKMMPFGVGRRICPGLGLGTLHVNLILARMVQAFRWLPVPGNPPDLAEKFAFTVIMKNSLQALIEPRS